MVLHQIPPAKDAQTAILGARRSAAPIETGKSTLKKKKAACREEEAVRYGYHATYFKSYLSERTQERIRKKNKQPGQY